MSAPGGEREARGFPEVSGSEVRRASHRPRGWKGWEARGAVRPPRGGCGGKGKEGRREIEKGGQERKDDAPVPMLQGGERRDHQERSG